MKTGLWNKTPYFQSFFNPKVFIVYNINVTKGKKKEVNKFFWYKHVMHGMADLVDCQAGRLDPTQAGPRGAEVKVRMKSGPVGATRRK